MDQLNSISFKLDGTRIYETETVLMGDLKPDFQSSCHTIAFQFPFGLTTCNEVLYHFSFFYYSMTKIKGREACFQPRMRSPKWKMAFAGQRASEAFASDARSDGTTTFFFSFFLFLSLFASHSWVALTLLGLLILWCFMFNLLCTDYFITYLLLIMYLFCLEFNFHIFWGDFSFLFVCFWSNYQLVLDAFFVLIIVVCFF